MKKIISILAAALMMSTTGGCTNKPKNNEVCFNDQCVKVELAVTSLQRMRGLQYRDSMSDDRGMLFIFEGMEVQKFWMKDTYIPLDMIWLDYGKRVLYIEKNAQPCHKDPCPKYGPDDQAMFVVEVNAGKAKKMGIHTGDTLEFRLPNLK